MISEKDHLLIDKVVRKKIENSLWNMKKLSFNETYVNLSEDDLTELLEVIDVLQNMKNKDRLIEVDRIWLRGML